jgi:hypothetical protein
MKKEGATRFAQSRPAVRQANVGAEKQSRGTTGFMTQAMPMSWMLSQTLGPCGTPYARVHSRHTGGIFAKRSDRMLAGGARIRINL